LSYKRWALSFERQLLEFSGFEKFSLVLTVG